MPSTERDRQVLRDIEGRLRHQDHFIAARFALLPLRAVMHRRTVRLFLAVEMALGVLVTLGAMTGVEAFFIAAICVAVAEPVMAIAIVSGGYKNNHS